MTVSDLTQGAEYSFTVVGVDAEGRVGENSVSSTIVKLDSEHQSKSNISIPCRYFIWSMQTLYNNIIKDLIKPFFSLLSNLLGKNVIDNLFERFIYVTKSFGAFILYLIILLAFVVHYCTCVP